ncbi:MAG: NADH-quinone oxidoreductase subunit M [Opitutaceae bacterium]|nr:NADH-quinone oxidoreductase subunit M [Cytophagales bacterium]
MEPYLLCLIVFLPLITGLAMLFVPGRYVVLWRTSATILAILEITLCTICYFLFINGNSLNMEFQVPWLRLSFGSFGWLFVDFHLKTDGLNLAMIMLSSLVFFVSNISSFSIKKLTKGYYLLIFLLMTSVFGCFLSHDFLLFFLFFEFMLLPMYFLIGIWGGERREYAAIKFFLYTLLGSVFILLVLIGTYSSVIVPDLELANLTNNELVNNSTFTDQVVTRIHTLDFDYIFNKANYLPGSLLDSELKSFIFGWDARTFLFFLFLIGFAIKLPVVPVHTWLPDAHVEAPTSVSVILAGILLKIGGYGIIKLVMPLFPDLFGKYAFIIALLGVISMLYAGMAALAQKDLKKLIAYSSISHMGFVMLGIASLSKEGLNGAIFQMVSHGLISSLLFLLAGFLYERTHDREIAHYRGLASVLPNFAIFSAIAYFASLGLPVFSGFIAEISVYMGAFTAVKAGILPFWLVICSLLSLLIGASYCLWVLQRMFFGEFWVKPSLENVLLNDLTLREWIMFLPLSILIIILGIMPSLLFNLLSLIK